MLETEIVDKIYKQLIGKNSIPLRLRTKKPIDDQEFTDLIKDINNVIKRYKSKNEIPKKLAVCFIDIYNQFNFKKGFYSDEYSNYLEDLSIQIQDLAYDLCEV